VKRSRLLKGQFEGFIVNLTIWKTRRCVYVCVYEMSVDKMTLRQIVVDNMFADKMTIDKMTMDEMNVDELL
jgi:hypothetical protein